MHWLPAILVIPYCIILLKIYRDLRKIKPFSVTRSPKTHVSLIISCRNEEESLPLLLQSLRAQDYPSGLLEIIIVDDGSDDNTWQIATEYKGSCRVIPLKNEGSGKKAAIRTGVNHATGGLIITTDSDCTAGSRWITTVAACFEEYDADLIISPVRIEGKKGFFGGFQELEFLGLQGITAGTASSGDGIMCNGANLAFTRDAYARNAENLRFDLNTGDDIFLLHSLKKEPGSKIVWLESAESLVTTRSSRTLEAYLSQRRRWLSKWNRYNDSRTVITGIATFLAVASQLFLSVAVFADFSFAWPLAAVFVLKSIPDFPILHNRAKNYQCTNAMRWFIPAQLIYPFYVTGVIVSSLVTKKTDRSSSPFRKGT